MRASSANTDRAIAEIRASNARTDLLLLNMQQQAEKDRQQAEKDRQQAEKERQQAEKERKDFNHRLARVSDSMGTLIEDMVAPNISRIAGQLFGDDPVVTMAQRVKRRHPGDPGRNMEIDLLVSGKTHVLVAEAKTRVSAEKISAFVERLREFPEFFPEYAGCTLMPLLASVSIDPSAVAYLNRQKGYGLAFADETMELVNPGQF
jgi:hypothetical protein